MSDVAGAFKILIESQPQSALDGFGKIVDSVKKAKSIMGEFADATVFLNSGLDLVMKTVDAASYVFDAVVGSAQKAGSAFLDLAARGGDFREQQVQFETFASSFGVSGDAIVAKIKDISSGTLTMKDTFSLATKGLASGLQENEVIKVLEFAKKTSEATGESFEQLGETMLTAVSKGSEKILGQFGILITEGDGVLSIVEKMDAQMARFGDTGFNLADTIGALGASWADLLDTVGMWLNEIPGVQRWFTVIYDTAMAFSTAIYENEAAFKQFLEVGLLSLEKFAEVFLGTFEVSFTGLGSLLDGGIKAFKTFFISLVGAFGTAGDYVIAFYNTTVDVVDGITSVFTKIPAVVVSAFSAVGNFVVDFFAAIARTIQTQFENILGSVSELVAAYPSIAEATGLDQFTKQAQISLSENRTRLEGVIDEQKTFFDVLGRSFVETDLARADFFKGLRVDEDKFSKNVNDVQNKLSAMSETAIRDTIKAAEDAGRNGVSARFKNTAVADAKRQVEADKAAATRKKEAERKADADRKKYASEIKKEQDKAARDRAKSEKSVERVAKATEKTSGATKDLSSSYGAAADNVTNLYEQLAKAANIKKDNWMEGSLLQDALKQQIAAENSRQERLLQAMERFSLDGMKHLISIEDAGEFVNGFMGEVFKEAGVRARTEMVKVAAV